jgi:glycosyltransferase involved in cell wall biosynthesis
MNCSDKETTHFKRYHFLVGTRWFGVLGPCQLIIEELVKNGYEVFVFGQKDEHYRRYFNNQCRLIRLRMRRTYFAPISDFLDLIKLIYFMFKYAPEGVHSFNPKPALITALSVAFFTRIKFFIGVTGLGNTFIRAPKLEPFIKRALRRACRRASFVFFQNRDDVDLFLNSGLLPQEKTLLFIGPGVDLRLFYPCEVERPVGDPIRITCVARLIWQKGIREFVQAAERLHQIYSAREELEFLLIGEIDAEHPDCIDPFFVDAAVKAKIIKHVPWTDDIAGWLRKTDIFVLHSYREGAPRAILEASACSLPTVGSDAIGVRELVINGTTGFLSPLKDVDAMVHALRKLIDDNQLRLMFGRNARLLIGEPYSLSNSSKRQLEMYNMAGYNLQLVLK